MAILFEDEIELVFTKLVEQLQKRGILPALSIDEKKQLIKTVTDKMQEENIQLDGNDLLKPDITKKLQISLVAAFVQKNDPSFEFDFGSCFKKSEKLSPEEKLKFQEEMKHILEALILLKPGAIRDALTLRLKICMKELKEAKLDKEDIIALQMYLLFIQQQLEKLELGKEDRVILSMLTRAREEGNKELVSAGGDPIMHLSISGVTDKLGLEDILAAVLDVELIEFLYEENIIKPGFETPTLKPWNIG